MLTFDRMHMQSGQTFVDPSTMSRQKKKVSDL